MKFRDILRMQREPTQYEMVIEKKIKKAKMVLNLLNDGIVSFNLISSIDKDGVNVKFRYHIPIDAVEIVVTFEQKIPTIKIKEIIIEPLDEISKEFEHDSDILTQISMQFESYGVNLYYVAPKITIK